MPTETLALFPLARAIVPGATLKLQIFEQRYLKLVRDCMEVNCGFGVVGLKSGGEAERDARFHEFGSRVLDARFHEFGCRVLIEDWDQLQNGLLGISVRADRRFYISSMLQQSNGLWVAQVDWLSDAPQAVETPSDYQGLVELFESLAAHSAEPVVSVKDASTLGWAIANLLPLTNQDFSELLSENDPVERLELLASKIDKLTMQ